MRSLVLAEGKTYGPLDGRVVLKVATEHRRVGGATFIVAGPSTITMTDRRAPYAVMLDAGRLRNGRYTVTVTTSRGHKPLVTATLVVAHKPRPVQPPRPAPTGPSVKPVPPSITVTAQPVPVKPVPVKPVPVVPDTSKPVPTAKPVTPTTSKPVSTSSTPPAAPQAPSSDMATEVVRLTNQHRAANGCPALTSETRLAKAAQLHSQDMATRNYFSHTGLDGRSPGDRITAQGYPWRGYGENIAAGQQTAASVVTGWMNSPGHRANILNCSFTQIGVGVAKGGSYGIYWTQNFGTPR